MMGCFFNKKPPPEIAFILRVLDETSVMNLAQLYAEARDKFQSQELMAKVNDRIKAVLKESGPSSTENQMTQPIDRDTAIALAKEAGFKASIGQTVDDKYHPDRNAIGKSVPVEWVQRFYELAVAHSRKDAEAVAYQYRMKPEWHDAWVKWQPCDKANFDDYVKAPVVNRWQFDARALYTHPPEADKLLQQALEALDNSVDVVREEYTEAVRRYSGLPSRKARLDSLNALLTKHESSITDIRTYLEGKK